MKWTFNFGKTTRCSGTAGHSPAFMLCNMLLYLACCMVAGGPVGPVGYIGWL